LAHTVFAVAFGFFCGGSVMLFALGLRDAPLPFFAALRSKADTIRSNANDGFESFMKRERV
jgi:hypothetical protein